MAQIYHDSSSKDSRIPVLETQDFLCTGSGCGIGLHQDQPLPTYVAILCLEGKKKVRPRHVVDAP